VVALHATATTDSKAVVAHLGVKPGEKASGTLRTLLRVVGWELKRVGRIMARTGERGAYSYSAAPLALPEGVSWEALTAKWLKELQEGGTKNDPMKKPHRVEKSANHIPRPSPPPLRPWPLAPAVAIPWPSGPPRPRPTGFAVVA
jgi:hypothetical protein